MTTTTLSSNKPGQFRPIYLSVMRRNLGYFGLISALIAIFYPVQYAREITKDLSITGIVIDPLRNLMSYYGLYSGGQNMTAVSTFFFATLLILLPFVLALMLNNYMNSKKAADVYHSLPIKRETLLLANAAAAMTMLAVPVILSDLAIIGMSAAKFGWQPMLYGEQLLSMVGWLIGAFAIYAITTLVMVLCGTVFDSFLYGGIVLHAAPIVGGIFMMLCSSFLYGYYVDEEQVMNLLLQAPTLVMIYRMVVTFDGVEALSGEMAQRYQTSNLSLVIYLVIGIAAILLAARLYRNRKSELAEMTGLSGPVQLIIKLIGTLACAVPTGLMFYAIDGERSMGGFFFWLVVGGVVGYVILDVILHRGFKNLPKRLLIGGVTVGIVLAATLTIVYGGAGYEDRVPKAEDVQTITINGYGGYASSNMPRQITAISNHGNSSSSSSGVDLSELANIQTITGFHKDLLTKKVNRTRQHEYEQEIPGVYIGITLEYQMKNGSKLTRQYGYVPYETIALLTPLEVAPEFIQQADSLYLVQPDQIVSWTSFNGLGGGQQELRLSESDASALLEAIRADLGARTLETLERPKSTPLAILDISINQAKIYSRYETPNRLKVGDIVPEDSSFYVNEWDVNTVRFLREKNLMPAPVDLEKCTAVHLRSTDRQSYGYNSNGLIVQLSTNSDRFSYANLAQAEADLAQYKRNEDYKHSEMITKDAGEIAQLASLVRATARGDERFLVASFFFEGGIWDSVPVLIPYDSLPAELQAKLPKITESEQMMTTTETIYE